MQIKDQWKYPRNWKVVTGAGALAAVGLAGLALTAPVAADADENGIELQEQAQVTQTTIRAPLPANGVVDLSGLDDNDSPFDDNGRRAGGAGDGNDSADDSPPRRAAGGGNDSADDSPPRRPAGGGNDSVDTSPASPDQDSPDQASPASPDQDSQPRPGLACQPRPGLAGRRLRRLPRQLTTRQPRPAGPAHCRPGGARRLDGHDGYDMTRTPHRAHHRVTRTGETIHMPDPARNATLRDDRLPAVEILLGDAVPEPLRAAVEATGARLVSATTRQVTWWPGRSITVRYRAELDGAHISGQHDLIATAGKAIPEGALVLESGGTRIGVWRMPHDPGIPGLAAALDPGRAGALLSDLGAEESPVETRLRAYRPGSRAVVEVRGRTARVFLKLVPTDQVEALHRSHQALAAHLPVPHSLGFNADLGLLALQALPGATLRDALDDPAAPLPTLPPSTDSSPHSPSRPLDWRRAPRSSGSGGSATCCPTSSLRRRHGSARSSTRSGPIRSSRMFLPTATSTRHSFSSPTVPWSACWTSTPSVGAGPPTTRPPCWATSTCDGTPPGISTGSRTTQGVSSTLGIEWSTRPT